MGADPVDVHLPRFAPLLRRAHEMVKTNALIRTASWKRRPLRPNRTVARPDKNAQERAFDHRTLVYAQRERTEPLPSRQLWFGLENDRQLARREAAMKFGGAMVVLWD